MDGYSARKNALSGYGTLSTMINASSKLPKSVRRKRYPIRSGMSDRV
ncbi:hypothetical protein AA0111_g3248 [Alternaria arborescens]|nr:hypothetical protein AA0111_g3248 [Alternaria arborescens]RYO35118.1 hypothetical protein AA0111_g3248 [Alternaria arborescens]